MTMNIERFVNYQDEHTPRTTHFEDNHDLSVTLVRGDRNARTGTWDGTVLVRLAVDDEDYAVVEVKSGFKQDNDPLVTIEQALAHLEAVRDRLRAFAGVKAAS